MLAAKLTLALRHVADRLLTKKTEGKVCGSNNHGSRLIMKKDIWRPEWHIVTNSEAHQVTGSTLTPGQVFPYPTGKLPLPLQKLPGLCASYISGYATGSISPENVTVLGEVAAVREDESMGKGYVWTFGVSGSGVYINGPYKFFDGHYFADTASVPVDKLFGNVPRYPEPPKTTGEVPPAESAPVQAAAKTVNVKFVLLDLGAKQVSLSGDFNGWLPTATPMKRDEGGHWETTVALAPGRYEYKFVVGGEWIPDPLARENVWNCHGTLNSVIEVRA